MRSKHLKYSCSILSLFLSLSLAMDASGANLLKKIRGDGSGNGEDSRVEGGEAVMIGDKKAVPVVIYSTMPPEKEYTAFAIGGTSSASSMVSYGTEKNPLSLDCTTVIADAISHRLIENVEYSTLTREHVESIFAEHNLNWGGRFNTTKVSKVGELLGAEVFIFAKVNYCEVTLNGEEEDSGPSDGEIAIAGDLAENAAHAVGKSRIGGVIGLTGDLIQKRRARKKAKGQAAKPRVARIHAMVYAVDLATGVKIAATSREVNRSSEYESDPDNASVRFLMFSAANEIAADFVDRMLARPEFDYVQMYSDSYVNLDAGVRLVRLGDCQAAADAFEGIAAQNAYRAEDETNGKILHNHGIALMCAGKLSQAQSKFRASYRLMEAQETLDMINLSHLLEEQKLAMAVEQDPIIRVLVDNTLAAGNTRPLPSVNSSVSVDPSVSGGGR